MSKRILSIVLSSITPIVGLVAGHYIAVWLFIATTTLLLMLTRFAIDNEEMIELLRIALIVHLSGACVNLLYYN